MATRIRLRRVGRKKLPLYRIVVADKESPRDGRFIEIIGTYNPKGETAADKVAGRRRARRKPVDREGRHADGHGATRCSRRPGCSRRRRPDGRSAPATSWWGGSASRTA